LVDWLVPGVEQRYKDLQADNQKLAKKECGTKKKAAYTVLKQHLFGEWSLNSG
jgi:hypothetical protein